MLQQARWSTGSSTANSCLPPTPLVAVHRDRCRCGRRLVSFADGCNKYSFHNDLDTEHRAACPWQSLKSISETVADYGMALERRPDEGVQARANTHRFSLGLDLHPGHQGARQGVIQHSTRRSAASMVASAGETDWDLAAPQFRRNYGAYNIIEFKHYKFETL